MNVEDIDVIGSWRTCSHTTTRRVRQCSRCTLMISSSFTKTEHSVCFVLCGGDVEGYESGYEVGTNETTLTGLALNLTPSCRHALVSRTLQEHRIAVRGIGSVEADGEDEGVASESVRLQA